MRIQDRSLSAGAVVLRGYNHPARWPTGNRWFKGCWNFTIYTLATIGFLFLPFGVSVIMTDGQQAGQTEFQQMMTVLQQVAQEQATQRAQMDHLQQAIGTTAQGVGLTQQVTEGVVTEVVQQVQASMQQRHQETQDQYQQMMQVVQGLHQRIEQVQAVSAVASGGAPAGSGPGSPVAGTPPLPQGPQPPVGSPTNAQFPAQGPAMFAPMSAAVGGVNPAIAYAIQQGGVDAKVLAKPTIYDPVKHTGYSAFNDWSDHVITCVDAQIPGTWEIMEYIKDSQPSTVMSVDDLNLHFPNLDKATLEYSNSNLYAVLITYTLNEARNIVRQARRPNGYEAWKLLHKRFNPVTIGRQRAGLTSIANPTSNVPLNQLSGEIVSWEAKITEFEARPSAERISEAIKMAALVSMCPTKLKDHLQLNAQRFHHYTDLREEIFAYLDHTQSAAATAMDVGAVHKGSGCYVCGGPHLQKDCPRRQKGGAGFGKGGKDKGKGKSGGKDKGKGKKGDKGAFAKDGKGKGKPTCANCGKVGHHRDQCWSKPPKPLNSIDPRLSQLQSEYAKRAMEEFQRTTGGGAASSVGSGGQSSISLPSGSPSVANGSSAGQVNLGGVTAQRIRQLGALSRRGNKRYKNDQEDEERPHPVPPVSLKKYLGMEPYCVRSNLDSGAAVSVAPRETFVSYPILPSTEGELNLVAANGETVRHYGEVHPIVVSEEGHLRTMRFQVADVNKVLTSAAQVANQGYRIVLAGEGKESYFEDQELGDKFNLYQEDGIYVHYLHVLPYFPRPGENFQGQLVSFPGQSSGSSSSGLPGT